MDRADAARVARAPGLEQVERLGPANLADRDAVGPQTERGTDELRQRRDAILGSERHQVRRGALQLARVLDQHDAIAGLGDLGKKRVDQGGLASGRPARDQDVATMGDRDLQRHSLRGGHDAGGDVVGEREHRDRRLADGERRCRDDRREQPLEALARLRQLGRDARLAGVDLGADMMRNQPDDPLAVVCSHPGARVGQPARQPVDPEPSVGIEHHLDDGRVFQPRRNRRPERGPEHAGAADRNLGSDRRNAHFRLPFNDRQAIENGTTNEGRNSPTSTRDQA